jgi:histidinol phosphatase-like enzyme
MPGLIRRAAEVHGIDVALSWMIGDRLDDVEAGLRAGCRAILLQPGPATDDDRSRWRWPDYTASDMTAAARIITGTASVLKAPCAPGL